MKLGVERLEGTATIRVSATGRREVRPGAAKCDCGSVTFRLRNDEVLGFGYSSTDRWVECLACGATIGLWRSL